MDNAGLASGLNSFIGDYLKSQGIELVEFTYSRRGRDRALRILVDKPRTGITMGECANLNRGLKIILEENNFLKQDEYILEVFSPGLDRPLTGQSDFARNLNKQAVFFLKESIDGALQYEGVINKVEDGVVFVGARQGILKLSISKVQKAKILI